MVLEHDQSYMFYLYQNPVFLDYLRNNPHWYKILYYNPTRFSEFLEEAKQAMNLTMEDRISKFQKQLNFISSIAQYLNK